MLPESLRYTASTDTDFELTYAYVNQGRWVVDCRGCNTSWIVRPETPSLLIDAKGGVHTECSCSTVIVVQFPSEKTAIDELLELRPTETNRNWRPGESIFDLQIENAAHGVGGQ